ncbi:MAG: HD domain-containing phosphohydrolase [Candidatus Omnitrophota bacterium]
MKKKFSETETYLTPKEAAEHFNLSLSTVKNYIYAGKLKTLKTPGGHHRIRRSELLVTLGDVLFAEKEGPDFSLEKALCAAMLAFFRILGPVAGNSLQMHARNVSVLSVDIARSMGMDELDIGLIETAALVHDIGHIAVDRAVLLKSGALTAQEYELIKLHARAGEDLLNSIKWLKGISGIVAQHHERMDGKGYPQGLSGRDIDKRSRVIAVAEAYNVMVSPYSYRDPLSKERAISELLDNRGTQFDGDVVAALIKKL